MDLWKHLQASGKPIISYGTGNGADKIFDFALSKGIKIEGIFVSDDFVREGKTFRGLPVESYAKILDRYGDFIVLVCFASPLPEVIDNILKLSQSRETYIPCVPAYGEGVFTEEYFNEHIEEIKYAREIFADKKSREIYDKLISYRLDAKPEGLLSAVSDEDEILHRILRCEHYENIVDAGAYNGDTAGFYTEHFENCKKIFAFEPDVKNFGHLVKNTAENKKVLPYNIGLSNKKERVEYAVGDGRGSSAFKAKKTRTAELDRLDALIDKTHIDFIKYDVEGAEEKALLGSRKIIERDKPDILISVYHRTEDIFYLPKLLFEICGEDYNLYLRRHRCVPDWEVEVYAIKKD